MSTQLYKNSLIFFTGTLVAGFGGYLYQLAMGRMLSLEDFGTLGSLIGFFSFIFVPAGALVTVTTQIVASLKAKEQYGAIHFLVARLTKFFLWAGALFFLFFLAIFPLASAFLRLTTRAPYIIFTFSLLLAFVISFWRGVLPGLQRFSMLSFNAIVESFLKLVLAVLFVFLTFGLSGAVGAIVVSTLCAFGLLFWQMRDVWRWPVTPIALRPFFRLALFVFFWTIALTALSSLDIILVKRFFTAEETGLYAGMNLLGKMIFFASVSVAGVFFPMSTELFERGNHAEHRRLMKRALALTFVIALGGVFVYWMFPTLVVTMLFGSRYLPFADFLPVFGVLAAFLSFSQLLATYFLSIRYRWFLPFLFAAPFFEGFFILFFHERIDHVLSVLLGVFGVLAATLLFLFFLHAPKRSVSEKHQATA